ncbi:transglutaminase family protein [Methylobacterium sp. BTF04]|uniref:transglutaminase-like domain-containing protein n=1 Tax=Methylobacterium sp. BTF04 TaxID=2708300 RepID=UPI0013D65443|nr:transglutaminase family protein [Methylobacterium sp. BTF04]NEU12767.1 transglutaminase family protein [Methylobacterium sp. BTF04]
MKIRTGYTIAYDTYGPTPMTLLLNVRPERQRDLVTEETITFDPPVAARRYLDAFGNVATRIFVPGGRITMSADFQIEDSGRPDAFAPNAWQIPIQDVPDEVLQYLLGSRYCDTDKLSQDAWNLFGHTNEGWPRVQAIVDYAHERLTFDYMQADATRSAHDGHSQRVGVCRDFAHLAITLCRCMNIPARYATGYLGDIGVPKDPAPMDFSAWFEVYLRGPAGPRWYTFDARHNTPRIARIVMAYGRDATDCALTTSFGPAPLVTFQVHTDEVSDDNGAFVG